MTTIIRPKAVNSTPYDRTISFINSEKYQTLTDDQKDRVIARAEKLLNYTPVKKAKQKNKLPNFRGGMRGRRARFYKGMPVDDRIHNLILLLDDQMSLLQHIRFEVIGKEDGSATITFMVKNDSQAAHILANEHKTPYDVFEIFSKPIEVTNIQDALSTVANILLKIINFFYNKNMVGDRGMLEAIRRHGIAMENITRIHH